LELDPTSARNRGRMALLLAVPGKYDQAIEELLNAIAMQPDYAVFYIWLGDVYLKAGRYEEAIAALQKAGELGNNPSQQRQSPELAYAYAVSGRKAAAQRMLAELKDKAKQTYVSPYNFAIIYHGLGDKEQTFAYLEKAYTERVPNLWG